MPRRFTGVAGSGTKLSAGAMPNGGSRLIRMLNGTAARPLDWARSRRGEAVER